MITSFHSRLWLTNNCRLLTMELNVLTTKLHEPSPLTRGIHRQRLIHFLNEGLDAGHSLTLVSAPAGFGGFSMGSVATWLTFQYALDYFHYFIPMSCGTSLNEEDIFAAAEGHASEDYFAFVMTGTDDFAYSYDKGRTNLMRASKYFSDIDDDGTGNFAFRVKDGYSHAE